MKKLILVLLIAAAFAGGLAISRISLLPKFEQKSSEEAAVLLERIEKVAKLVTVEGHLSEVYDYKDYYGYDWGIFRKKALIRVKANVAVGYDLGNLKLSSNPTTKTIEMSSLPTPEILSIDHEIDYYDLSEGTFNTFSKDDLNRLNKQAKSYIEEVARQGRLIKEAEARGEEMLEMIKFLVEGAGWHLNITKAPSTTPDLPG